MRDYGIELAQEGSEAPAVPSCMYPGLMENKKPCITGAPAPLSGRGSPVYKTRLLLAHVWDDRFLTESMGPELSRDVLPPSTAASLAPC